MIPWIPYDNALKCPSRITPKNSISIREEFWGHLPLVPTGKSVEPDHYAIMSQVAPSFRSADIVIWEDEIFHIAGNGCEAFNDQPFRHYEPFQIWFKSSGEPLIIARRGSSYHRYFHSVNQPLDDSDYYIPSVMVFPYLDGPELTSGLGVLVPFITPTRVNDIDMRLSCSVKSTPFINELYARIRFLETKIPWIESIELEAKARKHWYKHKVTVPSIKVVSLRKSDTSGRDNHPSLPRSIEWSHRWTVRPHWRNQFIRAGTHEPRFIETYVKGPEDKPLIVKEAVYAARR